MADAALGKAVLELSTDDKKLDKGLADVPKKVEKTGDAVKGLGKNLGEVNGLLETFGVGLSVGAVVAFGKSLLDMGDSVVKVHDKTGLAIDDVQRLQFIAEQSGNSIDDLSGAISKLQVRLADGKAKEGIEALGLNFKRIREESPYQAMADVAEAIGKIENPTLRAERAVQVFGKAGTEILPTLVANFKELGQQAPIASDETILALDAAGDALSKFGSSLKVWAAESYNYARGFFDKLVAEAYRMVQRLYENAAGLVALAAKLPGAERLGINQKLVDSLKESAVWYGNVAKAMDTNTVAAAKNKPAVAALPPVHDEATKAAKAHAEAIEKLTEKLSGAGAVKSAADYVEALRKLPPIQKLTKDAQLEIAKTMEDAIAVYEAAGKAIPLNLRLIALEARAASKTVSESTKASITEMQKAWSQAGGIKLNAIPVAFGFEDPTWATRQTLKATQSFVGVVQNIDAAKVQAAASKRVADAFGPNFWQQTFGSAANFGQNLGNAITSAIQGGGNVFNAAGGMIGQQLGTSIATKLSSSLMKEGASALSNALGGLLNAVLPGIGSLLGPLLSKVWNGIKSIFGGGSAGRDLVEQFAASFGGFDELHAKLLELGDAGEQLWIKLTQGVGKNDSKAAQAAIDEVTKALDAQADKQEETTQVTEEAALATIETATQASEALKALGPMIDENKAQWAAWSEAVTSDVNSVAAALNALRIPAPGGGGFPSVPVPPIEGEAEGGYGRVTGPTLFYSGGNEDFAFSGEGSSFGLGGVAKRPIMLENVIMLDGRETARNQARYLPDELERFGVRSR
jgi:hypothetical protein